MHSLLTEAAAAHPVSGNADGSYVTMRSKNGLIFGVINIIGNFGTVFQDQAYWQRAIASRPTTTVKAYLLGGLAWYVLSLRTRSTGNLYVGSPFRSRLHPLLVWREWLYAMTLA
jgi:urea-proton symporter